ncbi:MAG: aminotransferase class I/II-fold pyridoxal phosphate-dependent enzyme, partial [Nitrospiraceae bacterium]
MKLAARAGRIVPSPTLSLMAVAKALIAQGVDVVDFASGEPDFDTPDLVKAEAEAAIRSGFTKYTASSGIDELKRAITAKLEADQGLRYDPSQVLVSCGAKHTLYNLAEALLEAGDEVIIPTPFWVSYRDQVLLNDAT